MFSQPFVYLSPGHQQQHRLAGGKEEIALTTSLGDANALSSKPPASTISSKVMVGGEVSNNTWGKSEWFLGRQIQTYHLQQQQQHVSILNAISASASRAITDHGSFGSSPKLSAEPQNNYTYHHGTDLNWNAFNCESGTDKSKPKHHTTSKHRVRSDSDTATATTLTTPSCSLFSECSFSEDEHDAGGETMEFLLGDIEESAFPRVNEIDEDGGDHSNDCANDIINVGDRDEHDTGDIDNSDEWSHTTPLRRNASSFVVQEASEALNKSTETTTTTKTKTETTTTTTTTLTHTTTASTTHKNKNIFVYPRFVPGNNQATPPANATGIAPKHNDQRKESTQANSPCGAGGFLKQTGINKNANDSMVPFSDSQENHSITTAPSSALAYPHQQDLQHSICCPCCASKQQQIERQDIELKQMNMLVKQLSRLLADVVRSQNQHSDLHNSKNRLTRQQETISNHPHSTETNLSSYLSPKRRNPNEQDSVTTTTSPSSSSSSSSLSSISSAPQRKISSLPITCVGSQCPRSKNHRIEVNGESGTYRGPSISRDENGRNHYQRAGILQGCVVRFDNGDLYVGSLSRNDTGSLTFYPPGTLYDATRTPKRRLR